VLFSYILIIRYDNGMGAMVRWGWGAGAKKSKTDGGKKSGDEGGQKFLQKRWI
jgi:hypothetical protein